MRRVPAAPLVRQERAALRAEPAAARLVQAALRAGPAAPRQVPAARQERAALPAGPAAPGRCRRCGGRGGAAGGTGGAAAGAGGTGGNIGGAGGASGMAGGPSCGSFDRPANLLPPDILVLLDASGSMNEDLANQSCTGGCGANSKWSQMTAALTQVVAQTDATVNWGLKMFADSGTCGVSNNVSRPDRSKQRGAGCERHHRTHGRDG